MQESGELMVAWSGVWSTKYWRGRGTGRWSDTWTLGLGLGARTLGRSDSTCPDGPPSDQAGGDHYRVFFVTETEASFMLGVVPLVQEHS